MYWQEQQRKELAARQRLVKLAADIAQAMGPEWKSADTERTEESPRHIHINHVSRPGMGFWLHPVGYETEPARIEISGTWPPDYTDPTSGNKERFFPQAYLEYTDDKPKTSITVSLTRSPRAIAGDITRRLMPSYVETFAKLEARREKTIAYYQALTDNLQAIAAALGAPMPAPHAYQPHRVSRYYADRGSVTADVTRDTVTVNVGWVPIEQGKQIIAAIQQILTA